MASEHHPAAASVQSGHVCGRRRGQADRDAQRESRGVGGVGRTSGEYVGHVNERYVHPLSLPVFRTARLGLPVPAHCVAKDSQADSRGTSALVSLRDRLFVIVSLCDRGPSAVVSDLPSYYYSVVNGGTLRQQKEHPLAMSTFHHACSGDRPPPQS